MLSYQHTYHAGNFADVVKHLVLLQLLDYLKLKDKPFFYLETHSGRGFYDLQSKQSLKTGEINQGIKLLWDSRDKLSEIFTPYLQHIQKANPKEGLRYYPGSPSLAIQSLRNQDRIYCCELHPTEFECLSQLPKQGKKVFYSHCDGLKQLNALLPPPERRGLIFIDPSFEIKNEYKQIPVLIKAAYQHFSTGTYALWYPLVDRKLVEQLVKGLSSIEANNTLHIQFHLNDSLSPGMQGCGLWIINPPYVLKETAKQLLHGLTKIFNPGKSSFFIQ